MQTTNPISNIDPNKPIVALTFDDGPSEYTSRILDALQQHGGRVSFFVTGSKIAEFKNKIFRAHQMECEILCHAWDHSDFTTLSIDEIATQISRTNDAIADITGSVSNIFRPPYGNVNKKVIKAAKKLDFAIANWSLDSKDLESKDTDTILSNIMSTVKSGDIVLCHDVNDSTARAIELLIPELVERECQLLTISELLHYKYGSIESGKIYL